MFLRYDFCFPAFRRRSWEEEPEGELEGRVYVRGLLLVGLHSMCVYIYTYIYTGRRQVRWPSPYVL